MSKERGNRNVFDILGIKQEEMLLFPEDGSAARKMEPAARAGVYVPGVKYPGKGIMPEPLSLISRGRLGSAEDFLLRLEAIKFTLAAPDELVTVRSAMTKLEPFQVECVGKVMRAPRQRFLVADDVGLGKTIEAGMILRELSSRGRAERVLIICPAPLTWQWRQELVERFGEEFEVFTSAAVRRMGRQLSDDTSPWEFRNRVITSIDYAKQRSVMRRLQGVQWDLVIIDEAHRMSVSSYGEQLRTTQRYRLGELLAEQTESLLLLTATPHRGDRGAFFKLMSLLDPYRFSDPARVTTQAVSECMIRRGKSELRDESGRPVFRRRRVNVVPVRFSKAERSLYDAVTEYTRSGYNAALSSKNTAGGFAMVLLQRRMASSIKALATSLKRRLDKLRGLLGDIKTLKRSSRRVKAMTWYDTLNSDTAYTAFEGDTLARTRRELGGEIETVARLRERADKITTDSKAKAFRRFIDGIFKKAPDERVLVFTEYYDTLEYLAEEVLAGYAVGRIHGGMPMERRRERIEAFRRGDTQLLVCTDAAGEGLNMQFCRLMVNYELPWNPNRIDQRLGRLHRYGQKRDVTVYHLQVKGTREAQIFEVLQRKIERIEEDLGGRISEVLGSVIDRVDFETLVMRALDDDKPETVLPVEIEREIERRAEMLKSIEREWIMQLDGFDLGKARAWAAAAEKTGYAPRIVESFVKRALKRVGGRARRKAGKKFLYRVTLPEELKEESGISDKTFDAFFEPMAAVETQTKKDARFIGYGNPFLSSLIRGWSRPEPERLTAAFLSGETSKPSLLIFYTAAFNNGDNRTVEKTLFSVCVSEDGEIIAAPSLDSLRPAGDGAAFRANGLRKSLPEFYRKCKEYVGGKITEKTAEIQEQLGEARSVRRGELDRHFSSRLEILEGKLDKFRAALEKGAGVALHIKRVEKDLRITRSRWEEASRQLEKRMFVSADEPEMLCAAVLLPDA